MSDMSKPLPPPPTGYTWQQNDDHTWKLIEVPRPEGSGDGYLSPPPAVIEHIVLPTDTLQGICLRYRVSTTTLRRHNVFSGSNIKFLKKMIIPLDHSQPVLLQQHNSRDIILQSFRNETNEGAAEAKLYLDDHDWDLAKALEAWRKDDAWAQTRYIPPEQAIHLDNVVRMVTPAAVVVTASAAPAGQSSFMMSSMMSSIKSSILGTSHSDARGTADDDDEVEIPLIATAASP